MAKGGNKQQSVSQSVTTTISQDSGQNGQLPVGPSAPRPMRLKILYSLDDLMPNCLARAKEVAQVRVVQIDADTAIGLVDLRSCVLNITYSSPEILHHYGCDYSVYAYDYSEPDTPVVGLGLLSWVLSLPALNGTLPDPETIAPSQSSRIVTGRVQKNLVGLFAGGVKETLEVRMRLCKVPALKQAEYVNQMNQYSNLSKTVPPGMDIASWWTQAQIQNNVQTGIPDLQRGLMPVTTVPVGMSVPPGQPLGPPINPHQQYPYPVSYPQAPYYATQNQPVPLEGPAYVPVVPPTKTSGSAAPTPTPAPVPPPISQATTDKDDSQTEGSMPPKKKQKIVGPKKGRGRPRKHSEPALPSSEVNPPINLDSAASESINSGPSPHLAPRIPKSSSQPKFRRNQSDPANTSTARPYDPTLVNKDLSIQRPVGEVFRSFIKPKSPMILPAVLPTRFPKLTKTAENPTSPTPAATSPPMLLPSASITMKESPCPSPESAENSPQQTPGDLTDIDSLFIGSSPPISSHARNKSSRFTTNEPSPDSLGSPSGEVLVADTVCGMSDALQGALSRETTPNPDDSPPLIKEQTPDFIIRDPSPVLEDRLPAVQTCLAFPSKPVSSTSNLNDTILKEEVVMKDSLLLPTKQAKQKYTSESNLSSDVVDVIETGNNPPKKRRFRATEDMPSCATTKERIERQMKEKISAGEMPNYCTHCGQIETPTWRKVKICSIDPVTNEETEKEILLCNRKCVLLSKQSSFTDCVACGLWHHNHKTMRPEKFWDKPENGPKPPRKPRRRKSGIVKSDNSLPSSEPGKLPSFVHVNSTGTKREEVAVQARIPEEAEISNTTTMYKETESDRQAMLSAGSLARAQTPVPASIADSEWIEAIQQHSRRVQSSPPPSNGTVEDPISLVTPQKPVNRVLFPESKHDLSNLDGTQKDIKEQSFLTDDDVIDKENLPPTEENDEHEWVAELEKELGLACENEDDSNAYETLCRTVATDPSTPSKAKKEHTEFVTPIRKTPRIGKSPWRTLTKGTPSKRVNSLFSTPISKLIGTSSKLMSPASGEIILQLLQNVDPANVVPSIAESLQDNKPIDFGTAVDFSNLDLDFEINDNDFLIDSGKPMPSSPPPSFRLYEDGVNAIAEASSSLWSDVLPSSPGRNATYSLDFLNDFGTQKGHDLPTFNFDEDSLDLQLDSDLVVDFSQYLTSGPKLDTVEEESAIPSPSIVATKLAEPPRDLPAVLQKEDTSSPEDSASSV